ncbi:2-phospho-L-lactate transferase [Methanothermococcus okinawensis]|uniref:2-phospho-L-lactate transferase n=1 Tax=Methanothermococcus okinawensis (strain DSM 14208 / JCM 11175 / IH1) TaxID=647113 RepID=F8AKE0_METOI|nr:2-phospho-L-lactate transferase [Methanothermococcus okinawensis]AEH06340.1 LPPG:FO 2-phospho-L-lactate transferase [Methanothermococcus okinawensis IH1]
MKVCVLSGGTGTPKLIQGLKKVMPENDISVIVNTAEDTWVGDLYLSPDIDTVLYTFSDQINEETWYGVKEDTFITHETLKKFESRDFSELLRIGDKDRALKMHKTHYINKGYPLSKIVDMERELLNIKANIYPMTDDNVETKILINENNDGHDNKVLLKFHNFWINKKGEANVLDVFYENSNYANAVDSALDAIENCDFVIIGPSNPITSIGPILSIKDIKNSIKDKVVFAVSPIVGDSAISGPAGILMKAKGYPVNVVGVYEFYKDIINTLVIDNIDKDKINNIDCNVLATNTIMNDLTDKINLAKDIIVGYKSLNEK